jgi:hypothetical protein
VLSSAAALLDGLFEHLARLFLYRLLSRQSAEPLRIDLVHQYTQATKQGEQTDGADI